MSAYDSQLILARFSQGLEILSAANSRNILVVMRHFQLLDRLSLVFVLIVIDDLAGCASQSHKALF